MINRMDDDRDLRGEDRDFSRIAGESDRAYAAARAYALLGPRTRAGWRVAVEAGVSREVVKDWSTRHSWVERSRRWDRHQMARRRDPAEVARQEEVRDVAAGGADEPEDRPMEIGLNPEAPAESAASRATAEASESLECVCLCRSCLGFDARQEARLLQMHQQLARDVDWSRGTTGRVAALVASIRSTRAAIAEALGQLLRQGDLAQQAVETLATDRVSGRWPTSLPPLSGD